MEKSERIIDTRAVADLARLSFSEDELHFFEGDMEKIVSFAKKVGEAEAESFSRAATLKNVVRNDIPDKGTDSEALLSTAPGDSVTDGFFSVLRVVE